MHQADVSIVYEKKAAGGGQHQAAGHFAEPAGHAAAKPTCKSYYDLFSILCENCLSSNLCQVELTQCPPLRRL